MNEFKKPQTQDLIDRLSTDLKPVRVNTFLRMSVFTALAILLYMTLVIFGVTPPRNDLSEKMKSLPFAGMIFLPLLAALNALLYTLQDTLSQRDRKRTNRIFFFCLICFLYLAFTAWHAQSLSKLLSFHFEKTDLKCAFLIVLFSFPIWIISGLFATQWLPLSSRYHFGTALLSTAIGMWIINLHCPLDNHNHHFIGHGIGAIALVLGLYPIHKKLFKVSLHRITRYRTQKLLS